MISKELINTQLGAILAALGKPVCNAANWQEELGDKAPTEAEILAKKAELDAVVAQKSAYQAAIDAGFDIGHGVIMSVSKGSSTTLNNYAAHLERKFLANAIGLDTLVPIVDKDNVPHQITYQDFVGMLIPLGDKIEQVYFLGLQAGVI